METGFLGRFVWNLGGSVAWPVGSLSNRVHTGGGFTVGLTYNVAPPLGFQLEYGANWAGLKTGTLANAGIGGTVLTQYINLNLILRTTRSAQRGGFYLIGGGGYYYRGVDVTRATGVALAPYCDPWLYFCSTVPVQTSAVVGSRSRWDWGVDGGAGITFAVARTVRLYIEARYHYIFGPTFTQADGTRRTANSQFVPLTVGFRF